MLATVMAAYGSVQASPPADVAVSPPPASSFSLPPFRLNPPCPAEEGEEIVVCGRRDDERYRLREPHMPSGMTLPEAPSTRFRLGDAEGNVDVTQIIRPDGLVDRRIMVHVRVPF